MNTERLYENAQEALRLACIASHHGDVEGGVGLYKLMVKDTIFAEEFGIVSDEWFFVVRELDYLRKSNKKSVQEHYAYQMDLFDSVVKASFPEA